MPAIRARTLPPIGIDEPTREFAGEWSESSEEQELLEEVEPADQDFDEGDGRRHSSCAIYAYILYLRNLTIFAGVLVKALRKLRTPTR